MNAVQIATTPWETWVTLIVALLKLVIPKAVQITCRIEVRRPRKLCSGGRSNCAFGDTLSMEERRLVHWAFIVDRHCRLHSRLRDECRLDPHATWTYDPSTGAAADAGLFLGQ